MESQESYLTTGMLPYKHSRFFPQYARLYNAAASPASRLPSAGLVGNNNVKNYIYFLIISIILKYALIKSTCLDVTLWCGLDVKVEIQYVTKCRLYPVILF